jgi:hypothetical protein
MILKKWSYIFLILNLIQYKKTKRNAFFQLKIKKKTAEKIIYTFCVNLPKSNLLPLIQLLSNSMQMIMNTK